VCVRVPSGVNQCSRKQEHSGDGSEMDADPKKSHWLGGGMKLMEGRRNILQSDPDIL
jgi:hypothetical protein